MNSITKLFSRLELDRDPRLTALVNSHEEWKTTANRLAALHLDAHMHFLRTRLTLNTVYTNQAKLRLATFRFCSAWSFCCAMLMAISFMSTVGVLLAMGFMVVFTGSVYGMFQMTELLPEFYSYQRTVQSALTQAQSDMEFLKAQGNKEPLNSIPA